MDCIFCKIIAGEIPAKKLWEDDDLLAFADIDPKAPVHVLIIPKKHIASLNDVKAEDRDLMGRITEALARLAKDQGVAEAGYRMVINCGPQGGQSVDHIHAHLLGGRQLQWPPG